MAENFGLKIGLEGEKEFKSQLAEINQSFKVLGSEMKLVDSQFDKNDNSVDALTAKNQVLEKSIDSQKQKIETLRSALSNASDSFGETDKRTQKWKVQLNNAQAELNQMEKELKDNTSALDSTGKEMDEAKKSADKMGDEIADSGKKAEESSPRFQALGSVCKAVGVTMAAAFAAVTAAAVAAGKALISMTKEGAAYADTVLTESTVTGIATDKLQEYMYAAELVDVSTDTLTKSMAKQIKSMKAVQDGTKLSVEAYEKLGVGVLNADGTLRNSDDVYWEVIDALGKIENETERDALAMQILGKSAQELNPIITSGADRMKELGEQAHEAGYVLSDEMLNAYGALDDQLQYLKNGSTALNNALGTILLPILTDLATDGVSLLSEFTKGIKDCNGDVSKMSEVVGKVLPKFLNMILKYIPQIMEMALTIVESIASAIMDNLDVLIDTASEIVFSLLEGVLKAMPKLAEGAIKLVKTLANGILANLPKILEAAIILVVTLANGISDALPELIPAIVAVIAQLVKTLVDNLPLILDAALKLVKGLADGIITAIPVLIQSLPEIIISIVDFLLDAIPQIIDAGIELLTSLVEALPTIIAAIIEAIPQIIDGIINAVFEAIPQIIDAGIRLLVSLIENLPTIIETIVTAIPQIITGIVNALIGNIDKIIMAGVQLFMALITNLPTIIQELLKAIPQIVSSIVNAFGSGFGQMSDVGKNLVKGLWEGIQGLSSWIWDKVSSWAGDLWSGIKNFFGIKSPSKKMAWIGDMLMEGMADGIDYGSAEAVKSADSATERINDVFNGLSKEANFKVHTNINGDETKKSILDSISDVYLSLKNSVKDGLGSINEMGESTQRIEVSVPVYLDGEEIATATGKIQSSRNFTYKRAMGV